MSADRDRGIRRQKQKRAKQQKRAHRQQYNKPAAPAAQPPAAEASAQA